MKFLKVSSELAKKADIHAHIQKQYVEDWVYYYINSDFRKATLLKNWIEKQLSNPDKSVQDFADTITSHNSFDKQALAVLQTVRNAVTYKSDKEVWSMSEYWATAEETLQKREGDCDDGAILAYVLCRLKGIPADRLYLFAGNVWDPFRNKEAGHCWLGYRPELYPLNFVFLDWCYYYDTSKIDARELFYIHNQTIYGSKSQKYRTIWFGFNEEHSHRRLSYSD